LSHKREYANIHISSFAQHCMRRAKRITYNRAAHHSPAQDFFRDSRTKFLDSVENLENYEISM
jgi:hypothetical protein